jgi:hypothetical protein
LVKQVGVWLVRFSSLPPGVLWDENGFDKGIELVEQDIGKDRADHASYNVAKKVVEFEYQEEIPRYRLRAAYGDGFKGAPLRCQVSGEGGIPLDAGIYDGQATQALSISRQAASAIGGSHHV